MKKAKRKKIVEFNSDTDKDSETVEEETEDETLHKKWKISIKISSVNVTKSAGNCGFSHIY